MNSKTALMRSLVGLGIVSFAFLAGCGGGTNESANDPPQSGADPAPVITTTSPSSAMAGGAAFTLTVNGTNFVSTSKVHFGGTTPTTTFVSSTQLTAAIPASAIASAGNAAVGVTDLSYGSNAVNFAITNGSNPVATIVALVPSGVAVGGPGFTLTVDGQSFLPSSVVQWNGSNLPTTFIGQSLIAQIPEADIASIGTATVTVFNPGGSSNEWPFTIGGCPQSIAVDPAGKFAYVANYGCSSLLDTVGNVSMFTVDSSTGALTRIGTSVPADFGTNSVTVDPSGRFVYVANWGDGDYAGSVSTYTINATTGALTSIGTNQAPCALPSPGSCAPWTVVVHPSGKFVYVANEGGFTPTSVSMYSVDPGNGALAYTGLAAAGGRAISVAVDPMGKFAYVTTGLDPGSAGGVSMYTINATTGALTSIGTIAAETDPSSVAVDPTGQFAYVANSGSNDVSMYTINAATGALTSTGTIAAGSHPTSVAIHPSGKFAYVTNSGPNDVSIYTINAATGALTSAGITAAGSGPTSIAIHPSGKFAYVTNFGSNNVSMYSIDADTGALTLIGTIGT
jgi:YVTN family beta-propeller protein